jgi:predicted  nucleic acid-binding Zn-ribbon protein
LDVLRREREERVAKVAELETVVKQVRESLAKHESDFGELQNVLAQDEAEVKSKLDAIETRRHAQEDLRKSVLTKLRADILRKYTTIRDRKGTAVAEVRDGICRACHITLPPQLFAKLHAGTDIHQCPNCQRILLFRSNTQGA